MGFWLVGKNYFACKPFYSRIRKLLVGFIQNVAEHDQEKQRTMQFGVPQYRVHRRTWSDRTWWQQHLDRRMGQDHESGDSLAKLDDATHAGWEHCLASNRRELNDREDRREHGL